MLWRHRGGLQVSRHPFLTSVLSEGEWSKPRPGRVTPWKGSWYPLLKSLGEPDGRSGRMWRKVNLLSLPRFEPLNVQAITSRNNGYAIPAPIIHEQLYFLCYMGVTLLKNENFHLLLSDLQVDQSISRLQNYQTVTKNNQRVITPTTAGTSFWTVSVFRFVFHSK